MSNRTIAITGMACLFPGSANLSDYWRNILLANVCTGPVPDDHSWSLEDMYSPDKKARDKTYAKTGGFLDKVPFDPMQFGLTPNALDATDTSQLLSLIVAREALKDAGVDPDSDNWARDRTACIMGVTGTQEMAISQGSRLHGPTWKKSMLRMGLDPKLADAIVDDIKSHFPEWQEQTFPGLLGNVVAGRITNRLDLGGTNCVIDAACASSTAAMRMAIDDLLGGRSDMALTGGADTINDIFMYMCFSKTPAMSEAGQARPFAAAADGTLIAEGISMMCLKRLEDAERDGDRIYATIEGMGSSSDGRAKSIYAPHAPGQVKAMERAYDDAGFGPETVDLVEAHGTGTRAGDATEAEGLKTLFSQCPPGHRVALGSVKSQIGHTKSTAGAAGMMKAALALYQKVLPPTAGIDVPNPKMGLDDSPLYVNTTARPWVSNGAHPRRAGVSAFGFGGTNFHVLLQEHGASAAPVSAAEGELFLFSADDAASLVTALKSSRFGVTLAHRARAVQESWKPGAHVVAFVATQEDVDAKFATAIALVKAGPGTDDDVHYGVPTEDSKRVAVLFPGQGSQYVNMARTLAVRHPIVREAMDRAEAHLHAAGRASLAERIYPDPSFSKETDKVQHARLTETQWAQPAIGAVSKGLFDLLTSFGVTAEAMAGHSYGELVALHASGALPEASLWEASRVRGDAMADKGEDRGIMAAVSGDLADIERVLATLNDGVVLANRNHPRQGVISGSQDGITTAMAALEAADLTPQRIPVSAAFHSSLVADAAEPLNTALSALDINAPTTTVYSNVTALPYGASADAVRQGLVDQVTSTVRFVDTVEHMAAQGIRTFVECGPKRVLMGLVRKTLKGMDGVTVAAINPDGDRKDGDVQLKHLLAVLATRGVALDLSPLLAETLPVAPRVAGSKATVWLSGANYRKASTRNPPKPTAEFIASVSPKLASPELSAGRMSEVRGQRSEQSAHAPGVSDSREASAGRMSEVRGHQSAVVPNGVSVSNSSRDASLPSNDNLSQLLAATRETLSAFQATQAATAQVHTAFLAGQESAHRSFERLFDTHARLVEAAATGQFPSAPVRAALAQPIAAPQPAFVAPAVHVASTMAAPAAAAVDNSFLNGATTPELSRGADAHPGGGRVQMHDYVRPTVADDDDVPLILTATGLDGSTKTAGARTAAPVAAPVATASVDVDGAMYAAIAEKTGYPADMLEPAMDLESDLGIDSIKRVEILAAVQEAVPALPELDNERMSALRTIEEVTGYLKELVPAGASAPQAVANAPSVDVDGAMYAAIAEKTGYPADMLEPAMDLESDLGIDSIKRVEILAAVQDAVPALPELDNERMSALRTIAEVTGYLKELLPSSASAPVATASVDVDGAMYAAIADKTGYPADMLEPGMDLESDLGIDSIKRVEILAAVQDAVPALPELDNERMSALRTIAEVTGYLKELLPSGASAPVAVAAKAAVATAVTVNNEPVRRRVVEVMAAPEGHKLTLRTAAIFGSDANVEAVTAALAAHNITVASAKDADVLVVLNALGTSGDDLDNAVACAFHIAREYGPAKRFVTVTDQDGAHGHGTGTNRLALGAFAGLSKTIAHEWTDGTALALDVDAFDADAIAREIVTDRGVVEVGLQGSDVVAVTVRDAEIPEVTATAPVNAGDLVVVSGGARGVTAAVVLEMAKRWKPSLLLLGRSPVPNADPDWALGVSDDGLKMARINAARAAGNKIHPKDADRDTWKVLAAREVRTNLAAIRATGATVTYTPTDIRNDDAVNSAVSAAVATHGPVRGIVHGAGVIADKKVLEKTDDAFDRVYGTKVDGMRALLNASNTKDLGFVATFGSVAGRFGNLGQCDYAMANEVLSRTALQLSRQGVRARCFAWGPWEAGMVTPSLKKQLAARGMSMIPLVEGSAFFCDDLECGMDVEVVVGGPEGGSLLAPKPTKSMTKTLVSANRFMQDHRINGKPVLPAVMVLEWMASAATTAFPAHHFAGVRDFAVLKGVVVENGTAELKLEWDDVTPAPGSDKALSFRLTGAPGPLGRPTVHYSGTVDLSASAGKPVRFPGSNGLGKGAYPHDLKDAYKNFLFHGPGLQGIKSVTGMSDHGMVATLGTSQPGELDVDGASWETDPLTLDSLLQLMVLWVRETTGSAALPCALGNYQQYAPLTGDVTVHLEMHPTKTARGSFDATLVDADGNVVATLTKGEYAANPSMNDAFRAQA